MASRNLKPKNSSDSEGGTEWTFIDSDEGTIETNKDCVTYRKPTYSEILKGVVAEDLVEEVESEPEFEVLASFKFRPKGESFGLGSSASKAAKNAEAQGKESKQEDDESPSGDDLSSSDDGIMIISSNAIEASPSKGPSHACDDDDDDDCNKIDETDTVGSLNDEIKDKAYDDDDDDGDGDGDGDDFNKINETNTVGSLNDGIIDNMAYAGENVHVDNDDDDDFVIADESESDFEEATMDDTAEPDDENDDHDNSKQDVESDEEELSESTANTLNASTAKDESHDEDSNSDDGLLGIHKGGICDNPGKGLDWDSLTFQLLSTLPRMSDSVTTLGDDSQNPNLQDSMTESSHDSDSEKNSHSSYAAVSQDDSSSFDELSDPADVNRDLHSEPMIPRWLFSADKNIKDTVESFDDDSDYNISDIEELDFEEGTLIPQWFYDPSHEVEVDESVDEEIEFIDSDIDKLDVLEKDPDSPRWLYNPSHRVEDLDDVEDPNPIVPRWIFDPNYKIPDFDETYAGDTDYSGSDYEWETDDDDLTTLPGWLFDKNVKPPIYEDDDEGFAWPSQLFVDIPTFIILLCLTTALGFSIGHGLTLYFASQGARGNAKLQDIQAPKEFPSPLEDLGLTAEEIAKIDLLRLEDELEQQKDADMLSEHLRFDLRELYKSLKEKHHRLLRSQRNTEDRLHISKTMSWYWRMKYDEEKRRNEVQGVPKNLRLKNFSDMANLARKTKLAKKWRRLYKKNDTARLEKSSPLNANLKWLFNLSKAAIIQHKGNSSRYLMKAMALLKKNDMKKFRNRWTQDSKELKEKSCTSHPNKRIQIKRKAVISSPFAWVNSTQKCRRVDRSDILGRCLIKESPLVQNKFIKPTIAKPAKNIFRRKTNYLQTRPCFSKPVNDNKRKKPLKKKVTTSSKKITQKPKKKSARRVNKEEKVLKERIKMRELKKKAIEIKNQVDELKAVLTELRRERRRAEIEKAKLELSWRKLKRQRLAFEKERKKKKKNDKKKVKKVKSKLRREKARLKTWKNVAKRAQKKAEALRKDLRRVSASKQKLKDIKHIKKGLKLEKRKLREQQKNLKSLKQQLRKEHRNYARERWKTKKKRRELEKQGFSKSETMEEKSYKAKKQEKKNNNHRRNTDQPSTKHSQYEKKKKKKNKKKHKAQKKFWENLEKSLYHWAEKVNKTIQSHRHGKAGKIWSKLRRQFDRFVSWTTGKSSKTTVPMKKKKKEHPSKTKVKMKNPVFEKILAEQMKYDEEKRNRQKDSENQWKSKGPVVMKKKKKERKKKDPKTLLRQKKRKERRKYQRELERLQQWALQMNEKKLEHERIYRKKEKKTRKCFKSRRNPKPSTEKGATEERDSFSSSRALVSVGDSNSTLMLLLQPRITTPADYERPKTNSKQTPESQDQDSVIRGITKSQINHELEKKKTDTSLAVPLVGDVIKLPGDVSKGIDVTSFEDKSYHSQEPTPPSLGPTFYKDFPILRIIDEEKRKKDGSVSVADILSARSLPKGSENARDGESGQRSEPWYMRRAEQRDNLRNTNPALTMFPRPIGPLKSDGTWFFHRSSDRALQRELYEPLNRQSARDGFQNNAWRSYFHRRSETNDGKWVFERASNRAEQRSNNEPWYMRRADGREEDREESKDSWFVERGFDRDMLQDYDEDDDEYDDFMNDYDYDDYADRSYDKYEGPWL